MVISAKEGITKPDPRMFTKATELLGPGVDEVVFVDDFAGHVRAAINLGMRGFRIRHPPDERDSMIDELSDLRQLLDLVEQ